jgi:hypothetical protein
MMPVKTFVHFYSSGDLSCYAAADKIFCILVVVKSFNHHASPTRTAHIYRFINTKKRLWTRRSSFHCYRSCQALLGQHRNP